MGANLHLMSIDSIMAYRGIYYFLLHSDVCYGNSAKAESFPTRFEVVVFRMPAPVLGESKKTRITMRKCNACLR